MGDETLVVVDEVVDTKPVDWTRGRLVGLVAEELASMPLPLGSTFPHAEKLPTIDRALALRDAALEMLHAGTHDGDCLPNASGACILHLRMFRVRQAKLAQALGYGETCSMCKGSRLVTTLPGAEAWGEWEAWLREASDEDRAAMGHVRAIPCPVCAAS